MNSKYSILYKNRILFREGGENRMEENTIRITKRNDEELIFDISRITEAIFRITEAIFRMFETLLDWDDLIDDILENAKIAIYTALHSIRYCIANSFLSRRKKERKPRHIHRTVIMAAVLIPCVHTTTVTFSSFAILIRKVYLQRTQDRGSDDPSSNGYFNYIHRFTNNLTM